MSKIINYLDKYLMPNIFCFFIKLYRIISKYINKPRTCRFYPSCSSYALEAFTKKGFIKGFWLTLKRLLKCHPFSKGGVDFLE